MARPRPLVYQVRQVKTPYHGKSWKVTAYIGGKRKQHWFASEREAKTFADDSTAELHADQFLAEYETLLLRRVESGELKSGSHKVIKETFVKLKTEFGNRILSEISSADIERWLDRMSVGMRTKSGIELTPFKSSTLRESKSWFLPTQSRTLDTRGERMTRKKSRCLLRRGCNGYSPVPTRRFFRYTLSLLLRASGGTKSSG